PLPKELVELELLNRALEKALKVRKSISKTLLEVQGATEEKPAARTCSSKAVACKQGRSHGAAVSAGDREGCAPAELQKTRSLSRSALNEHQSVLGGDSVERRNSAATGRSLSDSGEKSCGFLEESSTKENPTAEGVLGRSTLPRTGTLQEKGQQLKLPLPYRKAYSRNSRAWERCRRCPTSAEVAAARNRFMERIQTTVSFLSSHPAEIEEELRVLQDVPSLLSQYMEAEPKDYPTLQREYESLLTLEGLQTTVSQCLDKLQLLRADCAGDVRSCSSGCAPARGQTGDSAGVLAVPLLCYSRLQELRDLFALKLRVSMLHQQVALQKVVMAELLPVLESRLCPEEESRLCPEASTALLYRAAYTQLCAGGERFPVLVRDELTD
ncbi:TEDC2 protein, partial [Rhinopomastus cyanomelas]|nr:TEDC2 protein [Rhinopomastus cyanomelas]